MCNTLTFIACAVIFSGATISQASPVSTSVSHLSSTTEKQTDNATCSCIISTCSTSPEKVPIELPFYSLNSTLDSELLFNQYGLEPNQRAWCTIWLRGQPLHKFYFDNIVPKTGGECIQRLLNLCSYDDIDKTPNLPVKGVVTQFVDSIQSTPYQLFAIASIYLENNSSVAQECRTLEHAGAEYPNTLLRVTMTRPVEFKSTTAFEIPLIADEFIKIPANFTFEENWTSWITKSITLPSQNVTIPPKSIILLNFSVYKARFETNYLSNFTIDPNHDLTQRCIQRLDSKTLKLAATDEKPKAIFTKSEQSVVNVPVKVDSDRFQTNISISKVVPISTPLYAPIHKVDTFIKAPRLLIWSYITEQLKKIE